MKFKGEQGLRGRRPLKGVELLHSAEDREGGGLSWFNPEEHVELLRAIQSGIPEQPETLPNAKQFYQALLEFRYFLSVLCSSKPELLNQSNDQMADLAEKAFDSTVSGRVDDKGWLPGLFNKKIQDKIKKINPEKLRQRIEEAVAVQGAMGNSKLSTLEFAFTLKLVAPQQLRWIMRVVNQDLKAYVDDDGKPGIETVLAAAGLIILSPQRREEIISGLDSESIQRFKAEVRELQGKAIGSDMAVYYKDLWSEYMFCQQVLTASDVQISSEGNINLRPPQKKLGSSPTLPQRSIL